jgi:CRISPR-associated protein Cas2
MEEDYYFFDIEERPENDKVFVLIIYDITENKTRNKLAKMLLGYGFRIQKSAFEAVITKKKYKELLQRLPAYTSSMDSIRVYKIIGKGQVTSFGKQETEENEDVIVI